MPLSISLDAIRNMKDTDRIALSSQPEGVKTAGFWHKFKIFFGIGSARQVNSTTIWYIRDAIGNDPRFAAMDLYKIATNLLNQVRIDRAISAGQIKGILQELDRLAGNTQPVIRERAMMHLSACEFPSVLAAPRDEIANFIADHLSHDPAVQANPGATDLRQLSRGMIDAVQDAASHLGGARETPDPRLLSLCVHHLVPLLWQEDANGPRTLRPAAERAERMEDLAKFLEAAKARAREKGRPELVDGALKLLDELVALPDPGPFGRDPLSGESKLETLMKTVPLPDLERFGAGTLSAADVFNGYQAGRRSPAPGAARPVQPGTAEWPKIGGPREFARFFKTVDPAERFGEIAHYGRAPDAAGDMKQAFGYRGLVSLHALHSPQNIGMGYAISGGTSLSNPENRTQAMGLGRKVTADDGSGSQPTVAGWGVTGENGVSTAKSLSDVIRHGTGTLDRQEGPADRLFLVDTTNFLGDKISAWDMESTVYENGYKPRGAEDETHGEVNCSMIPFFTIVGWVELPPEVAATADADEKLQRIQQLPDSSFHYNWGYLPVKQ